MHTLALLSIISGAALVSASQAPAKTDSTLECAGPGSFYTCYNNGFRGYCTSDPCDKAWCPDYVERSCTRKSASSSVVSSTATSASVPVYSTVVSSKTSTSTAVSYSTSTAVSYSTSTAVSYSTSSAVSYSTATTSKLTSLTSTRSYSNSSTRSYSNSSSTSYRPSSATDDCSETSRAGPTSTKHWTDVTKSTEAPKTGTKPPATYTTAYSSSSPYVPPSHSHSYSTVPSPSPCPSCDNKCPPLVLPGCLQPAANYNYYMCAGNGFKGHCTSDPCSKSWCPDFKQGTCEIPRAQEQCTIQTVTLTVTAVPSTYPATRGSTSSSATSTKSASTSATSTATPSGKGSFYTCFNNGFRGTCSVDPCAIPWCPDYKDKTYEPVAAPAGAKRDETVCPAGTGYFQVCSNGFRGCCKSDACGSATGWCPQYKPGTFQPVSSGFTTSARGPAPTEQPSHHGSHGSGSSSSGSWSDPTVCAPGTGFYQVCGNGFRGCCKSDACTLGYCPSN